MTVRTSLKDHSLLASSSQRAGLHANEAKSYFSQGILYDNAGDIPSALSAYGAYLSACHRAGDVLGEALAYNHMGVDYQLLPGEENLVRALHCHAKHAAVADEAGQFIAHHNMGLCYGKLGQDDAALPHFEAALSLAVALKDPAGEAMAAGQLGVTLGNLSNPGEGIPFIQRKIALAEALGDLGERAAGYAQLGDLAAAAGDVVSASEFYATAGELLAQQSGDPSAGAKALADLGQYVNDHGDYERAKEVYSKALDLAVAAGDEKLVQRARVGVGIAVGNAAMAAHLGGIREIMVETTPILKVQSSSSSM